MHQQAFQDLWPEMYSHCFGCGRNNKQGLQIKSFWDKDETICTWTPRKIYEAGVGILCGGIVSTLIDCHCVNTAIAALYKAENREIGSKPFIPYMGGSINMKLMKPIFINKPVVLKAKIKEMEARKAIITCTVFSGNSECAKAEVIAIKAPELTWINL
ncbi:hypothetical protein LCGC14_1462060 [marine sediment metagenome]|uniref:Thioesterase domain-containing protein n=1 Tax=marine sediment metagenome TaxID=412755 RepID=A0A0F9K0X3_9ZZZZ|nr:PaaI family thioesterase [bacterium]